MSDTASSYETLLAAIDAQLLALASSPQASYMIGDIRVFATEKIRELRLLREDIVKRAREIPAEEVTTLQQQIDEFGMDVGEYHGEETQ